MRRLNPQNHPAKIGAHGLRQCRWCHSPCQPPRSSFCSQPCVHEYLLRSDVNYLRSQVFLRDRGVCAVCHLDTHKLRTELMTVHGKARISLAEERGVQDWLNRKTFWDADHVIPVSSGGGVELPSPQYLQNIQTLCIRCHRQKTSADIKLVAARRKMQTGG